MKLALAMLRHATFTLAVDSYDYVIPEMHGDAAAAMATVFGS